MHPLKRWPIMESSRTKRLVHVSGRVIEVVDWANCFPASNGKCFRLDSPGQSCCAHQQHEIQGRGLQAFADNIVAINPCWRLSGFQTRDAFTYDGSLRLIGGTNCLCLFILAREQICNLEMSYQPIPSAGGQSSATTDATT